MLVHGVDEDGPTGLVPKDATKDPTVKVGDARCRNEEVEPRVWHIPQTLGPELELSLVDSIEEVHVGEVGREHRCRYELQPLQQSLHFLQPST